jgi:hypothetical protein
MKKLFTLLATVTLSVMLFAQAPQTFSYQTVIRDNNWQTIANQNVSIEIAIREDAANGTIIYKEAHSSTTNDLGLVNLAVGGGGVVSGSWANIDWGNHSYFIQVAVDVLAGVNYIVMGTTQLRSVPYALYAENAGSSTPGPQGATGPTGAQGPIGLTGAAGTNGTNGVDGNDGAQGPIGLTGAAGTNGTNGVDGNDGAQGPIGLTGATGPQGPIGLTGAAGTNGTNGVDGNDGVGITHYVGELFGGGIVVAVWKESGVEKGLIASLTDVSASAQYSSITGTLIGATAQSPIDGQANTTAIVAQGDVSGAAYLCANYTSGGFSDWYLPAAWELNQCYNAAFVVNTILGATNGFQFANYWSSNESVSNAAWGRSFGTGSPNNGSKGGNFRVRAVRRF